MGKTYKIIIYVPTEDAGKVREAMGDAGAGRLGNYSHASFTSKGVGRFIPLKGANPAKGKVGELEEVEEERIEAVVSSEVLQDVLEKIRQNHPYEEPAIEVIELEDV